MRRRRPPMRSPQAPAQIYEYIIFRGADIKDLHVCESLPEPSAAPAAPTPMAENTKRSFAPSHLWRLRVRVRACVCARRGEARRGEAR